MVMDIPNRDKDEIGDGNALRLLTMAQTMGLHLPEGRHWTAVYHRELQPYTCCDSKFLLGLLRDIGLIKARTAKINMHFEVFTVFPNLGTIRTKN